MAYPSGNGGAILIGSVEIAVKQWTCNSGARTTENTHSGTGGYTNYEMVVWDARWTAEGPWNDSAIPDTVAVGLIPGSKITLIMQLGSTAKTQTLTNTIVEDFELIVDNSGDIVRWRATGKGGSITRPT
jgi:hypothetical protein